MNAYIVAACRSAVGKANRGGFRFTRPDTLAADVIRQLVASVPNVAKEQIDDVIVGNATPEAEQGLNVARLISLMALDTDKVPGMTVNWYCASGLETIAIASAKIHAGISDCVIAGGVESMSLLPMGGWRIVPNADVAIAHPDYYWGMGLTAEAVAKEYKISRDGLKRVGKYQEIANLAAFLVSNFSAYINGEIITIDGGEWLQGAGQFNELEMVTDEMWDNIEQLTRSAKGS